jgi:hypothetical protein
MITRERAALVVEATVVSHAWIDLATCTTHETGYHAEWDGCT